MSRGGRGGGFRGGRGGGPKPSGGPIIPKELEVKPDFGPTELFPDTYTIPFPDPLSHHEKSIIQRHLDHREKIHNGPLYTVLTKKRGLEDAFEDVVTYSKRYHRVKRKVPKLDARPYVVEFFPGELWGIMGVVGMGGGSGDGVKEEGKEGVVGRQKKRLLISSLNTLATTTNGDTGVHDDYGEDYEDGEGNGEEDGDALDAIGKKAKEGRLARLKEVPDEGEDAIDDDLNPDEEGGDGEDDDLEDEYEDDEEGDYNAETYFDDGEGEGDYGDYDDGGGDVYGD